MRNDETVAQEVALQWLRFVDSGQYEESWRHMAEFARAKIAAGEMAEKLSSARAPLGNVVSRDFVKSAVLEKVDGAALDESVPPCLEADGQFKVAGYYLS